MVLRQLCHCLLLLSVCTRPCGAPALSDHACARPAQYGEAGDALDIPPAMQVATPFGSNIGPTNPAFWPIMPDCQVRHIDFPKSFLELRRVRSSSR